MSLQVDFTSAKRPFSLTGQLQYLDRLETKCEAALRLLSQSALRTPHRLELENCWGIVRARIRQIHRQLRDADGDVQSELLFLHEMILPQVIQLQLENSRQVFLRYCHDPHHLNQWEAIWGDMIYNY